MSKIRVLLADDQQLIRDGIASLLSLHQDIHVVASVKNGREAVHRALEHKPDVILMDIRMPVMDGITATEKILKSMPSCKVLMLTTFSEDELIFSSLKAGSVGYLLKDMQNEDLARAVIQAYNGTFQMHPEVFSKLLERIPPIQQEQERQYESLWDQFSIREQQVIRLIGTGKTNKEIADTLNLSIGTIKNYVSNILTCLNLRDRTQIALLAIHNGWVKK